MSAVVVALIGFAGLIAVQFLVYWLARRERADVANETHKVAAALDASTNATTVKLDAIHVLVNSRLTEALEAHAAAVARIDELSERLGIPVVEKPEQD